MEQNGMTHAVSSHQSQFKRQPNVTGNNLVSEQGLQLRGAEETQKNYSNNHESVDNPRYPGRFSSLFNSLKAQYLSTCEKQQKLRLVSFLRNGDGLTNWLTDYLTQLLYFTGNACTKQITKLLMLN